jgi:deoxycytidine triphosphate deaminase
MRSMATQTLSLLCGEEIKSLKLVEGSTDDNLYRASTYDLSIGDIIPAEPASESSDYTLPPGGTVRVVSKELLKLPNDITGHALLKNELCRKGVLAINIGVIDPSFQGPLSSILINFGRGDFMVKQGDPFLRISFHRCPVSPKAVNSASYNRQQYVSNVRQEVAAYMAPTFLNMEETANRAAAKAFVSFREGLVIWATLVAVLLGLLAIFAPLGASLVDKYLATHDQREHQMGQTVETSGYEARLKALSDQVEDLKRTVAEKSGHASVSTGRP